MDGSDGEAEFDKEVRTRTRGKEVLDVGCGPGEFALQVAMTAKSVVGVDVSRNALALARRNLIRSRLENIEFRYGDIKQLPFQNDGFDLVYSRRGPASAGKQNLAEVWRVLREGGLFMEITIGERDKLNVVKIFGRGQMLGFRGQVSAVKKAWLGEVGFREAVSRDYIGTEVFRSMDDLLIRLRRAPIIPSFDRAKDKGFLEAVRNQCTTDRGVETPVHRVVLMARK